MRAPRCVAPRVFVARTARVELTALDDQHVDRVLDALGDHERDPHLGQVRRGRLTGLRSSRVGVCDITYELRAGLTVRVVAIRHPGNAYETDPR